MSVLLGYLLTAFSVGHVPGDTLSLPVPILAGKDLTGRLPSLKMAPVQSISSRGSSGGENAKSKEGGEELEADHFVYGLEFWAREVTEWK